MSLIRRLFSQAQTESIRVKNVLNQLSQVIIFIWLAFAVILFSPFVDKHVFWAIFIFCVMLHDKTYSAMLPGGHRHNQTHSAKSLRFS